VNSYPHHKSVYPPFPLHKSTSTRIAHPFTSLYQTQKPSLSSIASENKQSSMLHPEYAYPGDDAEAISDMFSEDFMIREKRNSKVLHMSPNILVWFGLAADCDIL